MWRGLDEDKNNEWSFYTKVKTLKGEIPFIVQVEDFEKVSLQFFSNEKFFEIEGYFPGVKASSLRHEGE